jgi:hypothetical protein
MKGIYDEPGISCYNRYDALRPDSNERAHDRFRFAEERWNIFLPRDGSDKSDNRFATPAGIM